jgi:triphosphoribosyl-dephospho-CoA synthase
VKIHSGILISGFGDDWLERLLNREAVGEYVGRCASLAALLEVSAYPKPGNVHRTRDFPDTRFEHFLAGGVVLGPAMRRLAQRGYDAISGTIDWGQIGIGSHILNAVVDSMKWQRGGNVNLGVVLLFAPLSAGAGVTLHETAKIDATDLRNNVERVVRSAASRDTADIYKAINTAMSPRTLRKVGELDVTDGGSHERIMAENISPHDVFEKCVERDSICSEWITGFQITFEVAHPNLKASLKTGDVNSAILDTFLLILSRYPDSLIIRKSGAAKASEVSKRALEIIGSGGANSENGKRLLWTLDGELHRGKGDLNPGTTADLTAAAIFVSLLERWRP